MLGCRESSGRGVSLAVLSQNRSPAELFFVEGPLHFGGAFSWARATQISGDGRARAKLRLRQSSIQALR